LTDPIHASLVKKLNPNRFSNMSGKMAAIVGHILGERFTEPEIAWMSISSDGFVTTESVFIGRAEDLENNLTNLYVASGLTTPEIKAFNQLYRSKVDDWRKGGR